MSNFIDHTYFTGELNIVLKATSDYDNAISMYQDEILKLLLGYKTWKEMMAAYEASIRTLNPVTLEAKWSNLINGCEFEYTINGETYFDKWVGFKNSEKKSLIANYVYFFYRRDKYSDTTSAGETISKTENSMVINPYSKLVTAWNKMVDMYGKLDCFDNPEPLPSAYNFLNANAADYPDWKFTKMDKILSINRWLV